jgi:hypothetical protein
MICLNGRVEIERSRIVRFVQIEIEHLIQLEPPNVLLEIVQVSEKIINLFDFDATVNRIVNVQQAPEQSSSRSFVTTDLIKFKPAGAQEWYLSIIMKIRHNGLPEQAEFCGSCRRPIERLHSF